jgi:predicted component of type VI protein secretion system
MSIISMEEDEVKDQGAQKVNSFTCSVIAPSGNRAHANTTSQGVSILGILAQDDMHAEWREVFAIQDAKVKNQEAKEANSFTGAVLGAYACDQPGGHNREGTSRAEHSMS